VKILYGERGITLIEVLVAMVIGLMLIAAFAGAFVRGLQAEIEVDRKLQAASTAGSIIELFRDQDITNIIYPDKLIYPFEYGHDSQTFMNILDRADKSAVRLEFIEPSSIKIESAAHDSSDGKLNFEKLESSDQLTVGNNNEELYRITVDLYWLERGSPWNFKLVSLIF